MANTANTRIEKLLAKSDKCWALGLDTRAPAGERDAALTRAREIDWKVGKLLAAARRAA